MVPDLGLVKNNSYFKMGSSTSSPAFESEKITWDKPHKLEYNDSIRERQLRDIENFEENLLLCHINASFNGSFDFEHWFVTDGKWFIEFGSGEPGCTTVKVHDDKNGFVNLITNQLFYIVHQNFSLTDEVKQRMSQVCGAINYSICLRNGEHLARYIYCGTWVSFQMVNENGKIRSQFNSYLTKEHCKLINTTPENIVEDDVFGCGSLIYYECSIMLEFRQQCRHLEGYDNSNYSILFLGPTGSGKSRLINLLFNKEVSKSAPGALSVTRDVSFFKGTYIPTWEMEGARVNQTRVNVIDTIGLCDSLMTKNEVYNCIKDKVKVNMVHIDVVVVVLSGRIESVHAEALKQYMSWLKYNDFMHNFVFVYNKADDLTPALITRNLLQLGQLLGVDITRHYYIEESMQSIDLSFATSFPPRARYDDIKADRDKLIKAVMVPRKSRLDVDERSCVIL